MDDAFTIFTAIDTLVLERKRGRTFRCLGSPPAWCAELWPVCRRDADELAPERQFPFLEVFLGEAERAWAVPTRVDSESWTRVDDQGHEIHLQATAIAVGTSQLLLISRCDALHRARQMLLQRARELRLVHELAGRAAEEKDVLVHYIIHDLQDPLATILGALGRMQDEAPSESMARLASAAQQAAEQQRKLILAILQIFAAERTAPAATDIVEVVGGAVTLYEPVARARGLTVTRDVPREPVKVVGDARRLERVVSNLLDRSLHSAITGVTIKVRREDGEVSVTLDNDGPPASREVVPELFAKPNERTAHDASRIGLYFCRITVERWGGRIGYDADRHGGTRFWLRLPLGS